MKAYLRLMGGPCVGRKRSTSSCQRSALSYRLPTRSHLRTKAYYLTPKRKPSAVSSQLSDMARQVRAISRLKPKTYQASAIGIQPSVASMWLPAKSKLILKAYHLIPLLILVFVSCGAVLAQEPVGHTAPAAQAENPKTKPPVFEYDYERFPVLTGFKAPEDQFTPIKIGDKIPDQLWDMPLWVVNHPEGKDTIKLREYENEKLIVLDFWATWCSPCIQSMDTWNEYLTQLNGEVAFFGALVFDQSYKALPFTEWKGWTAPSVIAKDAHILNRFFFHKYVNSRLAWIKNGRLLAITDVKGYDLDLVNKVLAGESVDIPNNLDWTY